MKLFLAALLSPLISGVAIERDERFSYDGYKVFRVAMQNNVSSVKEKLSSLDVDTWKQDPAYVDVAISPDQVEAFDKLGLDVEVLHEDLGASIAEESSTDGRLVARQTAPTDPAWFDSYHPYADHQQYFTDLQALLPVNSELISSGKSVQGRDIFGIHIWGEEGPGSKPAVLFHGTVHAREWITAMVVEYITLNLITGYQNDTAITSLIDAYDFYILPIVNPDGFVYTQTTQRLWRKNRQPPPTESGSSCIGRDINRNWPYQWGTTPDGASTDPCDETYQGAAPGDSPENAGLSSFVDALNASSGIKLYIDWHSYGQYMLSPYGYNCGIIAANNAEHQALAQGTTDAIAKPYGTKFTYGPSCSTLYATTGDSVDYVKDVGGAELSYTIELRDTGRTGFVLPPAQIRPSAVEQWEGMKWLLAAM